MTLLAKARSTVRRTWRRVRATLRRRELLWLSARPKSMPDERIAIYERLTLSVLSDSGPLPLASLIDRVAERSRKLDVMASVPEMDVGVWGSQVYRQEAHEAVRSLLGRSLALEIDGPWVLVSPAPRERREPGTTERRPTKGVA